MFSTRRSLEGTNNDEIGEEAFEKNIYLDIKKHESVPT